jgi:hypothetical protein
MLIVMVCSHCCWSPSCAGTQALRCLALAYKPLRPGDPSAISPLDEAGLTFLALVAMHDPPRTECAQALQVRGPGERLCVSPTPGVRV